MKQESSGFSCSELSGVIPVYYDVKYNKGLLYVEVPYLTQLGFTNAFTTRIGGVSKQPYDELNLGLHVGDEPETVIENRSRVGKVLNFPLDSFVAGEQVHGNRIAVVTEMDRGRGARDLKTALPKTDGMITKVPGILLMGFFADCVPILLADPMSGGIGLIHAGWRGTAAGIAMRGVARMVEIFHSDPSSYVAVIGPSIGPCCYYVQGDVIEEMERAMISIRGALTEDRILEDSGKDNYKNNPGRIFHEGEGDGGSYLDLWEANREQLMAAGLLAEKIFITSICTCCMRRLFYSYRAEGGKTGRIGAFIGRL